MGWHGGRMQHEQDLTEAEESQDKLPLQLQYWNKKKIKNPQKYSDAL